MKLAQTLLLSLVVALAGGKLVDPRFQAVAVLLLLPGSGGMLAVARSRPTCWLWLSWAVLSASWSAAPHRGETALLLLAQCWLGLRIAAGQTRRIILLGLALRVALSLAAGSLIQVDSFHAAWEGAENHKTYLGQVAALGVLAGISSLARYPRSSGLLVLVSGLLLALSKSLLSMVALAAVLSVWVGWRIARARPALLAATLLLALGLVAWNWSGVLAALGREASLTGRTEIWTYALEDIAAEPWIGYGLGTYWVSWERFEHHPHNLLLVSVLQFGVIGAWLFLLDLCLVWLRQVRGGGSAWNLLFLGFLCLASALESTVFADSGSLLMILYVASSFDGFKPAPPPPSNLKREQPE